jgi:hypothetical protein
MSSLGEYVTWEPRATFPVYVAGVGELDLDRAWRLRNNLSHVLAHLVDDTTVTVGNAAGYPVLRNLTFGQVMALRNELTAALIAAVEEESS